MAHADRELCEGLVARLRQTSDVGLHRNGRRLVFLNYEDTRGVIVGLTGMGGC